MKIGIQVSSDLKKRTGVEEYVYQLLKYLPMLEESKKHQFFLYNREKLKWPFKFGWTQIRLSWEILKDKPDVLFIPAHTFPIIHPKKLIVAIQGLEFEAVPETYGFIKRKILRFLTKRNAKKAEKIIVPSQTTKNDLVKYYKINPEKIFVIYHGVEKIKNQKSKVKSYSIKFKNYILYLGSSHKRKNIEGLKAAFKILKEKYKIPHELLILGLAKSKYVNEEKKWELLKNADVFVYSSFYEGFGFPVLEAQAVGVPVIASDIPVFKEILRDTVLLVNPCKPEEIAEAIYKIIDNQELRQNLIERGYKNTEKFNWLDCAKKTLKIITS